jgi:hypothetical protein
VARNGCLIKEYRDKRSDGWRSPLIRLCSPRPKVLPPATLATNEFGYFCCLERTIGQNRQAGIQSDGVPVRRTMRATNFNPRNIFYQTSRGTFVVRFCSSNETQAHRLNDKSQRQFTQNNYQWRFHLSLWSIQGLLVPSSTP